MNAFEHRIPPPFLALLLGAAMWVTASHTSHVLITDPWRLAVTAGVLGLALLIGGSAFLAFGRARTTIDPVNLERAAVLVTTGIFRISRNPMYVALTLLLLGWAAYLSAPWSLAGVVAFVLFIQRFQILPEERVMHAKFGRTYGDYQQRVRRWL